MNREHFIKRAVIGCIAGLTGRPHLESSLIDEVSVKLHHQLRPTTAEIEQQVRLADQAGLIIGVHTEIGRMFKLTVAGQLWLVEHT
jgi:hypothetical protein